MKTKINLSKILGSACLVAAITIGGQACNNGTANDQPKAVDTSNTDPKERAEDANDAKMTSDSSEKNAQFLVDAAEINMEEIQLGELAQKNGSMKGVKELGKMMIKEHTKALADLKALAAKKNITSPVSLTEDGQEAYKKLSDEKGLDFDKSYAGKMVDGHESAIDKFEKAANNLSDADIKSWAASMLPGLKTHLEHSKMVEEECKKMK